MTSKLNQQSQIFCTFAWGGLISGDGVSLRLSSKHILRTSLPLGLYLSEAKREIEFFFLFPPIMQKEDLGSWATFMPWGQLGVAMFEVRTIP